jgi:hypothetical protein
MRLISTRRLIFAVITALYLVMVPRPPMYAVSDPAPVTVPAGPIGEQTLHELQGLTERLMDAENRKDFDAVRRMSSLFRRGPL